MRLRPSGLTALLVLACATLAGAQEARPTNAGGSTVDLSGATVQRYGVDLRRIQRALRQSTERQDSNGLNIRYIIDVYGTAPRIEILDPKTDNLRMGPVPYGAPTHQQMLDVMTPQEFRAPAADFSSLMRWLQNRKK
jgi:hypothetical protein